jgi:hypothetical protein
MEDMLHWEGGESGTLPAPHGSETALAGRVRQLELIGLDLCGHARIRQLRDGRCGKQDNGDYERSHLASC